MTRNRIFEKYPRNIGKGFASSRSSLDGAPDFSESISFVASQRS